MMRSTYHIRLFALFLGLCGLCNSGVVYATAGDSIDNMATIDYSIGGAPQQSIESSPAGNATIGVGNGTLTSFVVDRVINFTVTPIDVTMVSVLSGQNSAVLTFTLTNNGNDAQDFLLAALNTVANPFGVPADNFNPSNLRTFVEDGTTAGYQVIEDTEIYVDELAEGANTTVYVVVDIPAQATNDVAALALVAQVATGNTPGVEGAAITNDSNNQTSPAGTYSNGGTVVGAGSNSNIANTLAGVEVVFNEPAGGNIEDVDSTGVAQDVVRNGQHADAGAYIVIDSTVAINKTVQVIDTLGGTDPHAGATLRYTLVVTLGGVSNVNNLVITDAIPANTTYTPASMTLNAVGQTDADDAPGTDFSDFNVTNANTITVNLGGAFGAIAPPANHTITFDVTID